MHSLSGTRAVGVLGSSAKAGATTVQVRKKMMMVVIRIMPMKAIFPVPA